MSETVTLENVQVIPQHLWRVNFELPKVKGNWVVDAKAQAMQLHEGDELRKERLPDLSRILMTWDEATKTHVPTAVMAETVTTVGGKEISIADIIEAGALFSDKWRSEDNAVAQE